MMKTAVRTVSLSISLLTLMNCAKDPVSPENGSVQWEGYKITPASVMAASKVHPRMKNGDSIPLEKVPMFICLGFDDNGIADKTNGGGATWILNYLKTKKNPTGKDHTNLRTYDGTTIKASFYMTGKYASSWQYENFPAVRDVWNKLYLDSNEIGNHSTEHLLKWDADGDSTIDFKGREYSVDDWLSKEIDPCQKILTAPFNKISSSSPGIGIPAGEIYGWRTPRLEWNDNVFSALSQRKFLYDCSTESDSLSDGKDNFWPYTMNSGHPIYSSVTAHPGLWELPASRFMIPPNLQGKAGCSIMTGLDYNVWITKEKGGTMELSGPEFTEVLKYTLDLRMKGNRSPFMIGLHSDIYSSQKDADNPGTASARERQLAIENFIDYALSTYPEVRIVTSVNMIKWMSDPIGL